MRVRKAVLELPPNATNKLKLRIPEACDEACDVGLGGYMRSSPIPAPTPGRATPKVPQRHE